jgi:Rha family phage regulatory protein
MGVGTISELGVIINNSKAVVSSRDIARVFEKEHKNVIRDIRELECSESFRQLNFEPAEYPDVQGKIRSSYNMTRDGAMLLIMGYTGPIAMQLKEAYIERFNELETALSTVLALKFADMYPNGTPIDMKWDNPEECPLPMAPYELGYKSNAAFKRLLHHLVFLKNKEYVRKDGHLTVITASGMNYLKSILMIGHGNNY